MEYVVKPSDWKKKIEREKKASKPKDKSKGKGGISDTGTTRICSVLGRPRDESRVDQQAADSSFPLRLSSTGPRGEVSEERRPGGGEALGPSSGDPDPDLCVSSNSCGAPGVFR